MIIIFEGIDGVGKSTLAKTLNKEINWPILKPFDRSQGKGLFALQQHFSREKFNGYFEQCMLMDLILQIQKHYEFNCILDRSMITTEVYQSALKGYDRCDELSNWWYARLKEMAHVIVYLKLDSDACYLNQMQKKMPAGDIIDIGAKKFDFKNLTDSFDEKMDMLQHSNFYVAKFHGHNESQRNLTMGEDALKFLLNFLEQSYYI